MPAVIREAAQPSAFKSGKVFSEFRWYRGFIFALSPSGLGAFLIKK